MPQPVKLKKLLVKFQVWGKIGSNIWCEDMNGRRQFFGCLGAARDYAAKHGYEGITVRTV